MHFLLLRNSSTRVGKFQKKKNFHRHAIRCTIRICAICSVICDKFRLKCLANDMSDTAFPFCIIDDIEKVPSSERHGNTKLVHT